MTSTDEKNPHTEIARRFLHERSDARVSRSVSPDGAQVACVVTTFDLDENTTRSRDLARRCARHAPGRTMASPDGRPTGSWLAFTSRRGEEKGDTTLHVLPIDGPGEIRTVCTMPDGIDSSRLVARRRHDRLHQPHPRRALRGQGRELAGAAQDRALLLPAER